MGEPGPCGEIQTERALRSVMGVAVPLVQVTVTPLPLAYGLGGTSATLDEAQDTLAGGSGSAGPPGGNHNHRLAASGRVPEKPLAGLTRWNRYRFPA